MTSRPPRVVVIASRNPGKLAEIRRQMPSGLWDLRSLDDVGFGEEIRELGSTYRENALAKARVVAAATGLAALADDSGLEVPALDGWPGVASARWLGPERTDAERLAGVLAEIERRCPHDRRARYVCVFALVSPDGRETLVDGTCWGRMVAPRGGGGFGYDPGFLSDDLGMTFAQASPLQKDAVSHRGRALAALLVAVEGAPYG